MVNKVILVGNLGKDPEVRYTTGGQAVANLRIATSRSWTDKQSGQKKEETEWHDVEVWGKQAEQCGEFLAKGRQVYVEGRLKTDSLGRQDLGPEALPREGGGRHGPLPRRWRWRRGRGAGAGAGGARPPQGGPDDQGGPPPGFDDGGSGGGGGGHEDIPF